MLTAKSQLFNKVVKAWDAVKQVKGQKIIYSCLGCEEPVIHVHFPKGKRTDHFRHKSKSNCLRGAGESVWHMEHKTDIYKSGEEYIGLSGEGLVEVRLEEKLENGRQADVSYYFSNGAAMSIELQLSDQSPELQYQRIQDNKDLGRLQIWALVNDTPIQNSDLQSLSLKPWHQVILDEVGVVHWHIKGMYYISVTKEGEYYQVSPIFHLLEEGVATENSFVYSQAKREKKACLLLQQIKQMVKLKSEYEAEVKEAERNCRLEVKKYAHKEREALLSFEKASNERNWLDSENQQKKAYLRELTGQINTDVVQTARELKIENAMIKEKLRIANGRLNV